MSLLTATSAALASRHAASVCAWWPCGRVSMPLSVKLPLMLPTTCGAEVGGGEAERYPMRGQCVLARLIYNLAAEAAAATPAWLGCSALGGRRRSTGYP